MSLNLFNEEVYLKLHDDIRTAVEQGLITAREHFEIFGRDEGRVAGYLFDPVEYLQLHTDVAAAVSMGIINVYDHFELFGASEGRAPFAAFDADYYLKQNPDVAAAVRDGLITAVEHFLNQGYAEGRNFNASYDMQDFLASHPDAAASVAAGTLTVFEAWVQFYSNAFNGGPTYPGGGSSGTGGSGGAIDGSNFDYGAIMAMLAGMGFSGAKVEEIQKLVLESGLVSPENLNEDGTGLKDPMPLVQLIVDYFYGDAGLGLVGVGPQLPFSADFAV